MLKKPKRIMWDHFGGKNKSANDGLNPATTLPARSAPTSAAWRQNSTRQRWVIHWDQIVQQKGGGQKKGSLEPKWGKTDCLVTRPEKKKILRLFGHTLV